MLALRDVLSEDVKDNSMNEEDRLLWEEYYKTKDINIRNKLVERYSNLVKIIAHKLKGVYEAYGDIEDVINEGIIALIGLIDRYDMSMGTKFETYASYRVRGAMIEFVKNQDWTPKNLRKQYNDIRDVEDNLRNKLGRTPTDNEIIEESEIGEDKYHEVKGMVHKAGIVSFELLLEESRESGLREFDITKKEENEELKEVLEDAIRALNEKEQLVISLYYVEELKFIEIAEVMNLGKARVSQIHANALEKLEKELRSFVRKGN